MENSIKFLENSLLYQMSLGSKELFHSNVWAWLIEKEPAFIGVFFKNVELFRFSNIKVEREKANRDIVVSFLYNGEKECFIIENKIKTLPTEEQLKRYTENIGNYYLSRAVFTGIINPFNDDIKIENNGVNMLWEFCSYAEISKGIKEVANKTDKLSSEQRSQVNEYCQIIEEMYNILFSEVEKNNGILKYENNTQLERIRLNHLGMKFKGADFVSYLKERININYRPENFQTDIHQSFNNGKVTIDIRYTDKTEQSKRWLTLGVQIEGTQYRIIAERNSSEYSCEDVYNEFKNSWFNRKEKSISMKKEYCKYQGKDYSFVYQYQDIDESNNTYDNLIKLIKEDLEVAKSLLDRIH